MASKWVVEGYFGQSADAFQRMSLKQFPVKIGRDPNLALAIVKSEVSRVHAEFFEVNNGLYLRDLNSTNGTFVNHQPIKGEIQLRHGDVVHFASYEVRVLEEIEQADDSSMATVFGFKTLSKKLPTGLNELQILLNERAIRADFQPIVALDGTLFAYEVLGRGNKADFPTSPMELFRIAESMPGKDAELSEMMRDIGVVKGYQQSATTRLFMNTHPAELKDPEYLLKSMRALRESCPNLPMVLEIHEDAITDVTLMKRVAVELTAMDVELAYDDFGAGQARFMELIDVPVKYVKFDIALIRGLHNAPESKQKMVAALAAMTKDMGIVALAEGVEQPEELEMCRKMHFDLIQGYYFSKPRALLDYINPLV